jgi:hypothetical protein
VRRVAAVAVAIALTGAARMGAACAVCSADDPTMTASGAEQPFAHRLRIDVEALVGGVGEAAADGRWLALDDRRLSVTAAYAPSRDVLVSLVVPTLDRTLYDGATHSTTLSLGDVDLRVYDVAWRRDGRTRRRFAFLAGGRAPTAPVERDTEGAPLPVELQPGCSSIVPYVGAAYVAERGMLSTQLSAVIALPFSVRNAPHAGDSLRMSAWIQAQPARSFATRFGVRARLESTGELAPGAPDFNSGGFAGYVTSDIVVSPAEDVVVSVGAAFPVLQAWLGEHRETAIASAQIAYDF